MNSDSESLQNELLGWLLSQNDDTYELGSLECEEIDGVDNLLRQQTASKSGKPEWRGSPQTFQLGEIPTVQERFQAVLKRRLQIQIEKNPPLFPWESQLVDYPECVEEPSLALVPAWGWTAQQSKLNMPIPLPERVFQELLEKCQALVTSSLPLGSKLVRVVESLFPQDSQALNDIAGLVLRSTYRSVDALESIPNMQSEYSDLRPQQQMALSLLAAKQLLENLTLPVSPTNPVVERQWLTSVGAMTLRVEYHTQGKSTELRVHGELPTKGILKVRGNHTQAIATATSAGCLSIQLSSQQPHPTYTLEVDLPELDQKPLLFVINPTL